MEKKLRYLRIGCVLSFALFAALMSFRADAQGVGVRALLAALAGALAGIGFWCLIELTRRQARP